MKPTQEQVIAWAREAATASGILTPTEWNEPLIQNFAFLAYEAGRKDENEACERICQENPTMPAILVTDAIRARREQ